MLYLGEGSAHSVRGGACRACGGLGVWGWGGDPRVLCLGEGAQSVQGGACRAHEGWGRAVHTAGVAHANAVASDPPALLQPSPGAESNPGIALLPLAAESALSRLQVLSCDASVLFSNAEMLGRAARRLRHLFVRWGGHPRCVCAEAAPRRLAPAPSCMWLSYGPEPEHVVECSRGRVLCVGRAATCGAWVHGASLRCVQCCPGGRTACPACPALLRHRCFPLGSAAARSWLRSRPTLPPASTVPVPVQQLGCRLFPCPLQWQRTDVAQRGSVPC